ncbi:hypothetical protein SK069_17490 [Patulibacter brassicae]|uniref:Uncharacterized protein n=1 Tax=Patulibacter brassicae TaxID=1705717 RepID=A0ABU4VNG8_9ACTN|nr:hypothetical protein [Patulibacter brassicae]MDX8153396.1 hypothetical protein [Patulibacter brassicae]
MSTTANPQQTDPTTLDHALLNAEIHAARLAGDHDDPQAAAAYRWVGQRLSELRVDAATVGGLEP